jgi:hypothetical protein
MSMRTAPIGPAAISLTDASTAPNAADTGCSPCSAAAWLCGNAGLRGRRNPDQLMPGSAPDCARVAAMRGSANVSGRRSTAQMKRSVLISHEEKVYWICDERPWRSGPPGLRRCPRSDAYGQAA